MERRETDQILVEAWKETCLLMAERINEYLFDGEGETEWVREKVGGTCFFTPDDFLTPEEMALILEKNVSRATYVAWRDGNSMHEQEHGYINLSSWLMGCRHGMKAPSSQS